MRRDHQRLAGPVGYASNADIASLPEDRAQSITGWLSQRLGKQRQVPQLRSCLTSSFPLAGVAPYYSSDGLHDKLVCIRASNGAVYTTPLTGVYSYYTAGGKRHVQISLSALTLAAATPTIGAANGIRYVQFKDELIIFNQTPASTSTTDPVTPSASMVRYWVDTVGNEYVKTVGTGPFGTWSFPNSLVPTLVDLGAASGGQSAGVYKYAVALVDEKGRIGGLTYLYGNISVSSADQPIQITVAAGHGVRLRWVTAVPSGYTLNIYRTVADGAVYLLVTNVAATTTSYDDTAADTALGDAAPTIGQNDAPYTATFGAVWKDHLVLNEATAYSPLGTQLIQISNTDSPVNFSVIAEPGSDADGLTLNCGSDTGDQVTALANLGSFLMIGMGRSIGLLQGQDSTDFEFIPTHKRGVLNHSSVVRAENEVPFLSNDSIYQLSYQNGFSIGKISLEIEDFFTEFVDTVGNGTLSDYQNRIQACAAAGNLWAWYWRNYYFISLPMTTLVYDTLTHGWTDTGWGFIGSAAVYQQQGVPDSVFVLPRTVLATAPSTVYWYNAEQQADDTDGLSTVAAQEITRPFDGKGPALERRKKYHRFTLFDAGSDPAPATGDALGTLTFFSNAGVEESYPIVAGQTLGSPDALFEQDLSSGAIGRLGWFQIDITVPGIVLGQRITSYSPEDTEG